MDGIKSKFVKAWCSCENPDLDSENPHFHNKYASLKATLKVIRDACKEQGIAYMQRLGYAMVDDSVSFDRHELVSYVTDGSDQVELSRFPVECPPNPQSFGSNLTYAKRQQAQADWGITGEPDDDGEAAANALAEARPQAASRRVRGAKGSASSEVSKRKKMLARVAELKATLMERGLSEDGLNAYLTAHYDVDSPDKLTDEQLIDYGKQLAKTVEEYEGEEAPNVD